MTHARAYSKLTRVRGESELGKSEMYCTQIAVSIGLSSFITQLAGRSKRYGLRSRTGVNGPRPTSGRGRLSLRNQSEMCLAVKCDTVSVECGCECGGGSAERVRQSPQTADPTRSHPTSYIRDGRRCARCAHDERIIRSGCDDTTVDTTQSFRRQATGEASPQMCMLFAVAGTRQATCHLAQGMQSPHA